MEQKRYGLCTCASVRCCSARCRLLQDRRVVGLLQARGVGGACLGAEVGMPGHRREAAQRPRADG